MCACSLKGLFPKQGSLKGCFRKVKAVDNYISLNQMVGSEVIHVRPHGLLGVGDTHTQSLPEPQRHTLTHTHLLDPGIITS